jgi:hypothetical protein
VDNGDMFFSTGCLAAHRLRDVDEEIFGASLP